MLNPKLTDLYMRLNETMNELQQIQRDNEVLLDEERNIGKKYFDLQDELSQLNALIADGKENKFIFDN